MSTGEKIAQGIIYSISRDSQQRENVFEMKHLVGENIQFPQLAITYALLGIMFALVYIGDMIKTEKQWSRRRND